MKRYEAVAAELRRMGLTIRSLPGEYCVNFRSAGEDTARVAETLEDALEIGRQMAAEAAVMRGKGNNLRDVPVGAGADR